MKILKGINPFWGFIAVLLGWTLFKHVDFQSLSFADPYFDAVYMIVLSISVYFIIKDYKNRVAQ